MLRGDEFERNKLEQQLAEWFGPDAPDRYRSWSDKQLRQLVGDLQAGLYAAACKARNPAGHIINGSTPDAIYGTPQYTAKMQAEAGRRGRPPFAPGFSLKMFSEGSVDSLPVPQEDPTMATRKLSALQRKMLRPDGLLARESPAATRAILEAAGVAPAVAGEKQTFAAGSGTSSGGRRKRSPLQLAMARIGGALDQESPKLAARIRSEG